MLSDEEKQAIEWLKRLVKINKKDNLDNTFAEILLNLIEKQSKEIEELKEKNKSYDTAYNLGKTYSNKKWEDKIKAKIQECREILYSFEKELELKANKEKYINKESMNCLLSQISILQSLLEKE